MTALDPSTSRQQAASRPIRRMPMRVLITAFAVCSILDLVAEAAGWSAAAFVFRLLAMPLLIGVVVAARPSVDRTVLLVVGALLFSWLGDTVGGVSNLAKIALFLIAQFFFIAAFWPHRRRSVLRRPWLLPAYGLLWVAIAVPLLGRAGELVLPIGIYGLSLVTMAVLATGIGRLAGIGGICFLISDSLLGIKWFYQPAADNLMNFLIMVSYLLAQALLVYGVLHRRPLR